MMVMTIYVEENESNEYHKKKYIDSTARIAIIKIFIILIVILNKVMI